MTIQKERLNKLLEIIDEIESFQFCGPSDDPDEQTAVIYGFKHLAKKFIGLARRINNQEFRENVQEINLNIDSIYEVYDLSSDIDVLIDHLLEIAEHPVEFQSTSTIFVDMQIIKDLGLVKDYRFDLKGSS